MRIAKSKLKIIIQEELDAVIAEVNARHDAKGRFASNQTAKTYSLTKNAKDVVGKDSDLEVPARGSITAKGKVASKFGMNTGDPDSQCGRKTIDGKKKKKTKSCKDYPKSYWQQNEAQEEDELVTDNSLDLGRLDKMYLKATIKNEVEDAVRGVLSSGNVKKLMGKSGCSWERLMKSLYDIETAMKGAKENGK